MKELDLLLLIMVCTVIGAVYIVVDHLRDMRRRNHQPRNHGKE